MDTSVSINLSTKRKANLEEIFFAWAIGIGRGLVILTETIALGAFLYRFTLDGQLSDLHDKILQESNVVKFFSHNESVYRNLNSRLALATSIFSSQSVIAKLYQDIINILPTDITLRTLTFSPDSLKMDLSTQSVNSLSAFIQNLREYPLVSTVSIDTIENKTANAVINASVSVTFKKS